VTGDLERVGVLIIIAFLKSSVCKTDKWGASFNELSVVCPTASLIYDMSRFFTSKLGL
jgi:hypothetical protein